jgi:hypothetical protein
LQHAGPKSLTSSMLRDLRRRFESILQPTAEDFNPLPAAACLLEPSLSSVMMPPEQALMLHAAKTYIIQECGSFTSLPTDPVPLPSDDTSRASACALDRFRFLSSKLKAQSHEHAAAHNINSRDVAVSLMARYITEAAEAGDVTGFDFWSSRRSTYGSIHQLAEDLLCAPASQAFVKRVFSLCGLLKGVAKGGGGYGFKLPQNFGEKFFGADKRK